MDVSLVHNTAYTAGEKKSNNLKKVEQAVDVYVAFGIFIEQQFLQHFLLLNRKTNRFSRV